MKKYSKYTQLLPWFICSLGALFYAYEYLLRVAPSVMTDNLMHYFSINHAQLGNLSAFYYYIYTPMQLCVGVLMDRYGPRRLLTMATLCCVIGSALFAATHLFWVAAVSRLLIGFGSAFAFVGVLKLATIWLPKRYFAMFTGLATALGMLGAICGDIIMTQLVNILGWRNTISISAICGIIIALLIGVFVRDHTMDRKKGLTSQIETLDSAIIGLLNIIKNPQMWIVGIVGFLLYIPITAFAELWGIPYLKQAHDYTSTEAAFAITMIFWGWVFGGPLSGWLSDTLKRRCLPLTLMPLLALATILYVLYGQITSYSLMIFLMFIFGIFTSVQVIVFALGRELNPIQFSATACAFVNMLVMMGGVVFQPLIGHFLDHSAVKNTSDTAAIIASADYQHALLVIPITLIISVFISQFLLRETYCIQEASEE